MVRKRGVALDDEEAVAAGARRYAPGIPASLASRKKKKVHERTGTSRHGQLSE